MPELMKQYTLNVEKQNQNDGLDGQRPAMGQTDESQAERQRPKAPVNADIDPANTTDLHTMQEPLADPTQKVHELGSPQKDGRFVQSIR